MTTNDSPSKNAIISVTDKAGLDVFAQGLVKCGYTLYSTGGTMQFLEQNDIAVRSIKELTNCAEILDGRVKTLHPNIFAGILFDRNNTSHLRTCTNDGIIAIDLVVVNLYDFVKNTSTSKYDLENAINYIDIGGPSLLRAAAKCWQYVMPVIDQSDYELILNKIETNAIDAEFRIYLAAKVFSKISSYDNQIASYFSKASQESIQPTDQVELKLEKMNELRYGENPHQKAAIYSDIFKPKTGFANITQHQGKELSYNNYLDLNAAWAIVNEHDKETFCVVKHLNPCGVCTRQQDIESSEQIFSNALKCDPKSAFGGIVASNMLIDSDTAQAICKNFTECVIAPEFSSSAIEVFTKKKNIRIIQMSLTLDSSLQLKPISGAYLIQKKDTLKPKDCEFNVVTKLSPSEQTKSELIFAMNVVKFVKSNAIVICKNHTTLAIGAGQMSRVDSLVFAIQKAKDFGHDLNGAVLASDAFFPFSDCVELAQKEGISSIIQPGGSIRDKDSIAACDASNMTMVFTGNRHFYH